VYFVLRVGLIGSALSRVDPGIALRALVDAPAHALAYLRIFVAPNDLSIERLGQVSPLARAVGWLFWGGVGLAMLRRVPAWAPRANAALQLAAAGLLWLGLLLVPACIPIETMGVRADRYAALPLWGVALALGALTDPLWRRASLRARVLPAAAAAAWALGCLAVTIGQVSVWRDNAALYAHSVLVEPSSAMAHYRLGVLAAREQRWPDALEHFEDAERLDGSHVFVLNNLGVAYLNLGRLEEAEAALRRVIEIGGAYHFRAWNNLAQVYFARAERERGCAALERSLAINPAYAFAQRNHAHFCASGASPPASSG
jgi:tetratricopeptide (TPR) repeat protein